MTHVLSEPVERERLLELLSRALTVIASGEYGEKYAFHTQLKRQITEALVAEGPAWHPVSVRGSCEPETQ